MKLAGVHGILYYWIKQVKNTVYCPFVDNTDLNYQPIGSEYQCKIKYSIVSPDSIFLCVFFLEK